MDIERRRQEAALGADRKPRLIEESELPPFLLQTEFEDADEDEEELIYGRGNRARKETNYDDQLSEREWLKVIGVSCTEHQK
jgi:SWI/SNF-related matrix-associated actin-dependent regulator of chromatin subfamily A member 2/4